MNNRHGPGGPPTNDNSALSLLVNAVDSRDGGQREAGGANMPGGRSLAETLRLRGLVGDSGQGPSLEEQLLMYQQQQQQQQQQQHHQHQHQQHQQQQQQQQQQHQQAYGGGAPGGGIFSQLRDQRNIFSQLGQQQQLAHLLGLGGGGGSNPNDMRAALAAQLRQSQAPQITQADLLALSRSGALQGLSGILGGGGSGLGGGNSHLTSEIEGMQRLEELERRQRLMAAAGGGGGRLMEAEMAYRPDASPEPRMSRPEPQRTPPKPSPVAAMEPSAATETNKEELEKAPGSVIVPCRARGMPMDHNFKVSTTSCAQCALAC
jgi:hypothetical protein